jgi:poly-gamma-glutamate system protein
MARRLKAGLYGEVLGSEGRRRVVRAGVWSGVAWALLFLLSPPATLPWTREMREASQVMNRGISVTADFCAVQGIPSDPLLDPHGSCLIGPEYSPLFTSMGRLEAKRTTLNPDLAGLLVHLLREAGVGGGDRVGIGASGSFPGLLLATLSAVESIEAEPLPILSLGASAYGATRTELHLLELHALWRREGVVESSPLAVSLGGGRDVGREFGEELQEVLREGVRGEGHLLLEEPELADNVALRLELYGEVAAFVNIGGAWANLGRSPEILRIVPGLSERVEPPPLQDRGVLFEMVARGIPVIHLLNIRGLALRHGLPWDPIPLPRPGSTRLIRGEGEEGGSFWLLTGAYLLGLLALLSLPTVRGKGE